MLEVYAYLTWQGCCPNEILWLPKEDLHNNTSWHANVTEISQGPTPRRRARANNHWLLRKTEAAFSQNEPLPGILFQGLKPYT